MLLVKAAQRFRGLQLSNLCVFPDQLSAFLVSVHPNQDSNDRNVQADDICSDLSCWWQLVKKKGCTKHKKKKKKTVCRMGDEPFWQILATRQMHKSEVWEDVFFVCVYACGAACIIQRTVVLPHSEHSGDDCLWPPARTDIPSELLLNCHHLSFPKEWPRLPRRLPPANFISYFSDEISNPPLTRTCTRRGSYVRTQRTYRGQYDVARGGERRGSLNTHKWTFQLDKQQPALSTSRGEQGY